MLDLSTTCRIHDPSDNPLNGTTTVRVDFTVETAWNGFGSIHVYGVFRADDSEIDFTTLSKDTQNEILKSCEKERENYYEDRSSKSRKDN